jgi:hypothetical protein
MPPKATPIANRDAQIYGLLAEAPTIGESTRKGYMTHLRRVQSICRKAWSTKATPTLTAILLQPAKTMEALEAALRERSLNSLGQAVSSIKAVIRHASSAIELPADVTLERISERWATLYAPLDAEIKGRRATGVATPRQAQGHLDWAIIYDKNLELRCRAYETRSVRDLEDLIISDFYCILEPRRGLDYTRLFLGAAPPEPLPGVKPRTPMGGNRASEKTPDKEGAAPTGYVDLSDPSNPTITVTMFKTVKKQGPWKARLPAQLVEDLKLSLEKSPRSYVFVDRSGKPYTSVGPFSAYHQSRLNAWFKVPATPTTLRHSRATQVAADPTLSLKEKEEIAAKMGHTFNMHLQYAYKPTRSEKDGSFVLSIFHPLEKRYMPYRCHVDASATVSPCANHCKSL